LIIKYNDFSCRQQLIQSGVLPDHIEIAGICTHRHSDRFFSARKLGFHSGRMLTGACLKGRKRMINPILSYSSSSLRIVPL
jgi:hypothetical protein